PARDKRESAVIIDVSIFQKRQLMIGTAITKVLEDRYLLLSQIILLGSLYELTRLT
ncbi:MAG: hypothetical protein ACI8TE_001659, partial [Francisella sp.]